MFKLGYYTPHYFFISAPGVLVGRVQVVDYDEGINSQFNLVIIQQTPVPQLKFNLSGLDLYATTRLDREDISQYELVIQATDRGTPSMTGSGTVTVLVTDINDHKPFFNVTLYEFNLSEKQISGWWKCSSIVLY